MKDATDGTSASKHESINVVRKFTDAKTGREIRQLTDFEKGAHLGYFRMYRQLPDGRMLAWAQHSKGSGIIIDPSSGDIELIPHMFWTLKYREKDGRAWYIKLDAAAQPANPKIGKGRQLWQIDLPDGDPEFVCNIPDELPGRIEDITIDGRHIISCVYTQDLKNYPIPTTKDVAIINRYFSRPREGAIWVYDLDDGGIRKIHETSGMCASHVDTSPGDPGLIRFCLDMPDALGQRVWTIRVDGSDRKPIRPQQRGEMVTHEFWWADPNFIGFSYQDRRQDPTLETHHWAEYSFAKTQFGIADLSGKEVYLSEPLNSYHSHLYCSADGSLVSGEGTECNSFVCAAAFSWKTPKLDMIPLAEIHTTYVPFRGQGVDCCFSADGKWLIYADKINGNDKPHQLFAVEVLL